MDDPCAETSVAIIGLTGRFPGAASIPEFWANVAGGVESVVCYSDEELRASGVNEDRLANKSYVRAAATLPDPYLFDAEYFNVSPAEADLMDPQHRIFLECASEALELAGRGGLKRHGPPDVPS